MAYNRLVLIVCLLWNGICFTEIASDGSGEGSGESSGEPLVIENISGSGDSSGSTTSTVIVPVSSGDGETGSGDTTTSVDNLVISSGDGNITNSDDGSGSDVITNTTIINGDDGANSGDGSGSIFNETQTTITSGDGSGDTSDDSFSGEGLLTTTAAPVVVDGSGSADDTTVALGSGDESDVTTAPDTGSGSTDEPSISGEGSGETNVTIPESGSGMSCDSITADSKPLEIFDITIPSKVRENELFQLQFRIKDTTSGQALSDLAWSDCSWSAAVTVSDSSSYKLVRKGLLAISSQVNINENTATVLVTGLSLSTNGMAVLQVSMTTTPAAYQITTQKNVIVESSAQQKMTVTLTQVIEITFEYNYNTHATEEFKSMVYNFVLSNSDGKVILGIELREGSIIARVTIGSSSQTSFTSLQKNVCNDLNSNFTLQYNGEKITMKTVVIKSDSGDTSCHSESSDSSNDVIMIGLISGIVLCVLGIAILCAILFWRFKIYPKRKIGSKEDLKDEFEEEFLEQYEAPVTEKQAEVIVKYLGTSHFVEEKLWRSSFSSLREKSILADNPLAPISTSIPKNSKGVQGFGPPKPKHRQRGSKKVPPVETTEPLPPLMINGRRVNIPTKFSPFKFSFKS